MFCKKCGKENADGVQFCASCGCGFNKALPATEAVISGDAVKAKLKRIPKIPLIAACAVLVVAFAFYQIAANATKPETVIKNHLTAIVNGDYGAVYNGLDVPDGKFTSKEQFVATHTMSVPMPENKIISLAITEAAASDLKGIKPLPSSVVDTAYKAVYSTQREIAPTTEIIMLTKKGKTLLFFDKYKVEPSNFIAQDYSVIVPVGIQVSFDGTLLDDTFLSEVENEKDEHDSENPVQRNVYTIPNTFFGEHTITAKSDFTEDYEAPIFAKTGSTERINDLEIKADISAQMRQMTEKTLDLLFNAMIDGKSFADISEHINLADGQVDAASNYYDSLNEVDWSNFDSRVVNYVSRSIIGIDDENGTNSSLTNRSKSPLSYLLGYTVSCDVEPKPNKLLWGDRHSEKSFGIKISFCYENGELKIYKMGV